MIEICADIDDEDSYHTPSFEMDNNDTEVNPEIDLDPDNKDNEEREGEEEEGKEV